MVTSVHDRSERSHRPKRDRASVDGAPGAADGPDPSRSAGREAVLRRIAAEVSGRRDLAAIFDDVLDYSMELFGADRAGLWLSDDGPVGFRLAGRRGLSDEFLEVVTRIAQDPAAPSARAAAARRPLVIGDPFRGAVTPELRRLYRTEGIRTACFVPVVFLDEPLGLLILYHLAPHEWPDEELELVGSFADQMATAIENARLYGSVRGFAARLEAIKDLAGRLARISDVGAIGSAIVAEVRSLYESDTARVYTVDHETGMCEPVAFGGVFLGVEDPPADVLRVAIGKGLTGWVAAHATPVRVADSRYDPRRLVVGPDEEPESMLLAPMTYEDTVRGVLVVSKKGIDRYSADDLTTLSIFAGFAAQALVNAENLGRLHDQQAELERRLASQRSLLDVNETLLSARDPHAVLDVIADSLRSVVRYDNLTIYRLERDRGVRVAVLARDRYAEVILAEQIPVGVGLTGWAVDRGEAVLANDAHLHPRAAQIPGTPAEPESLIVVPLRIGGDVIGTLNIGRMGEAEAHFSKDEFELTQLFAGQAAIALQNAEAIQAAETRARLDALTGLRNHGAFQADFDEMLARESSAQVPGPFAVLMLDLDGFKAFNDARGHPAGDNLLRVIADALGKGVRPDDRVYRYGGDEFAAILPGVGADEARKVARRVARAIDDVGTHADGPWVTVSVGAAAFPLDGRTKDELVIRADTELYLEKAARHSARGIAGPGSPSHAAAVAAVHESTFAIMARRDPSELLETIVTRAAALTGTEHGFLDLVDAEGVLRVAAAIGAFAGIAAHQVAPGAGVDGRVWESGEPVLVEDYDAWPDRPRELSVGRLGSVVGVPLTAGGAVVGVIGLASGAGGRIFNAADVVTLTRFARLASFALENARLHDSARAALVERERAEEELRARAEGLRRLAEASSEQALYDGLTGLPNRQLFLDRIEHAIGCAGPGEAAWSGVLLLDLDRFKVINESLGHVAGDQLLVAVARRLADVVRPDDTIGRLGGDEFGVLLAGVATEEAAVAVAQRLLDTLTAPFLLEGREAFVGASVGIALGRPGSSSATDLLREADVALYRAKGSPTVRHAVFTPGMSAAPLERLDLESDLRRAVERDELRLHYQPLIDLRSGRVVGHEALLRWQHPIRGLVGPYSFIPLAEETGLIVPIGAWVLLEACRQTREWQLDVPGVPNLIVSVNLSARQLARPDLADQVAATLRATGLDPACLELEITESIAMREAMAAGATLRRLHELGIRLVLDDFGTGYSSLAYLSQLQLDSIKVDRAFIAGITEDPANVSIIRAVAALAHGLGIEVTAEGIELPEQLAAVRELGCDRGQGFLFARPLPAGDAARALAAGLAAA